MDQAALLDALARALGSDTNPVSDYRIAKALGCSRQYISSIRCGIENLGPDTALRLAQLGGINPAYVLCVIAAQRAKRKEASEAWMRTAKKVGAH
jgi:plasmid maintenance system antidote protein VapI